MSTQTQTKIVVHGFLVKAAQLLVLASFLTPLIVVMDSFIFPFVVPRVLFFRITMSLALLCYVLLLSMNFERYRPRRDLITHAVVIFFASLFISTLFSTDVNRSIWDNHERMLGLYTLLHYGILYFVARNVFRSWNDWRLVWWVFAVLSVPVFVVGFKQVFDTEFLLNRDSERIASTLGNPIYVSAYSIFVFLLSAYLFLREKRWDLRLLIVGIGALAFFNFLVSNTRGTSLGFLAALVVVPLAVVFFHKDASRRLRMGIIVVLLLVVGAGFVLYQYRRVPAIRNFPMVGRILNINFTENTAETRFIAWNIAVKAWKDHPVVGWGPVNFYYAFNKYYNPRSFLHGAQETWFDNAHSMIFNTLTERGLFGLFSYLFLFIAPFVVLFKNKYKKDGMLLFMFGFGFLVIHFIHNSIVFENVTSYLYFFLFLAFVGFMVQDPVPGQGSVPVAVRLPPTGITVGAVLVVMFMIFSWNIQVARANRGTFFALQSFQSIESGMIVFLEVLKIPTPHKDDVRGDVITGLLRVLQKPRNEEEKKFFEEQLLFARSELDKSLAVRPMDIRMLLLLGTLNRALAVITQEKQYVEAGDAAYARALALSPRRQQLLFERASNALLGGDKDGALFYLQEAIDAEPSLGEAYIQYARAAYQVGFFEKAKQSMLRVLELGHIPRDTGEAAGMAQLIASSPEPLEKIIADLRAVQASMGTRARSSMFDDFVSRVTALREATRDAKTKK